MFMQHLKPVDYCVKYSALKSCVLLLNDTVNTVNLLLRVNLDQNYGRTCFGKKLR